MKKERSHLVDLMRGIGIVSVVWGHSGTQFSWFVFLFHMELFFFLSGYTFNEEVGIRKLFSKRIKTLYIPYVIWTSAISIIHYIIKQGIASVKILDIAKIVGNCLMFNCKDIEWLGPMWFIFALFVLNFVFWAGTRLLQKFNLKEEYLILVGLALLLLFKGSGFEPIHNIYYSFCSVFSVICLSFICMSLGWYVRKKGLLEKIKQNIAIFLISFTVLGYIGDQMKYFQDIRTGTVSSIWFFLVCSMAGIYFVYYLAELISQLPVNRFKSIVSYLGKNSMIVLILHGLIIVILRNRVPLYIALSNEGYFTLYTILATMLPILGKYGYDQICCRFKNKKYDLQG